MRHPLYWISPYWARHSAGALSIQIAYVNFLSLLDVLIRCRWVFTFSVNLLNIFTAITVKCWRQEVCTDWLLVQLSGFQFSSVWHLGLFMRLCLIVMFMSFPGFFCWKRAYFDFICLRIISKPATQFPFFLRWIAWPKRYKQCYPYWHAVHWGVGGGGVGPQCQWAIFRKSRFTWNGGPFSKRQNDSKTMINENILLLRYGW